MKRAILAAQALGRALMLPIAVLPVAALLLRLGQPDLLDLAFVSAAGGAMFSHLGLLFAIGVATGFARDGNGAAPLAGVVCFLIATEGAKALLAVPPEVAAGLPDAAKDAVSAAWRTARIDRISVPLGIVSGIVGGLGYNRFSGFRPPEYLAFFGGRRFVPIVSGLGGVIIAGAVGASFGWIDSAVDATSRAALASGSFGLFAYGALNRLLLVTGLHHILNNIAWFVLGDYHGTTGDLRRFFAGDPSAGAFMSGFFPVMMFGLPAACLAMYRTARPAQRKATGGMLLSLAATSFLTGVTEPVEFTFMFLAPVLYAVHAALTGVAMALMAALDVHLGFGFSAGLFDYVLNFPKARHPLLLLPVGLAYAAIYYGVFHWAILRFDLKTPGRGDDGSAPVPGPALTVSDRARAFVAALGGQDNLREVAACTTRLRLVMTDPAVIDEPALKRLGARGIVRPSAEALQVVLGPEADQVACDIRAALAQPAPPGSAAPAEEPCLALPTAALPADLLAAFGGADNVNRVVATHSRLLVEAGETFTPAEVSGLRGSARIGGCWHLLFEPATIAGWRRGHAA